MLKNCSSCETKHLPPYGKYCILKLPGDMAQGGIPSKDNPAYLAYLENKLKMAETEKEELRTIVTRLDRLELSLKVPGPTVTTATSTSVTTTVTGVTSAPVTSTTSWRPFPPVSTPLQPLSSLSSPWSTPTPWSAPPYHGTNPWSAPHSTYAWSRGSGSVPPGFTNYSTSSRHSQYGHGRLPDRPITTPAEMVSAPITSALEHLSEAIQPGISASTKGMELRPEYYIQHVDQGVAIKSIDHTKLTFRELISGMGRVLEYLVQINWEATSYLEHFNFLTKQASVHSFNDSAYVAYDRAVVDKVICGVNKRFVAGDSLAVSSHFHAGNLSQPPPSTSKRFAGRGRGYRQRRLGTYDNDPESSVPDGFPPEICYNFNYRSCSGTNCQKQHICRSCKGHHRAIGCQEKKEPQKSSKLP